MNNDIRANTEKLDRVVSDFASRLEEYIRSMEEEVVRFRRALEALGDGWKMDAYAQFKESMTLKMNKISAEIEKAKELKKYLDETAEQLKEMLSYLKGAAQ